MAGICAVETKFGLVSFAQYSTLHITRPNIIELVGVRMPSVAENLEKWNATYDWPAAGDEWSNEFGGTKALWSFILYPRLTQFLPANAILEIAPGHGRWTQFLKEKCEFLVGVDLAANCVEQCKKRFATEQHMQFCVNDGTSLAMVADNSIDFAFSFDSLVHAEKDVIKEYLKQLALKLRPGGMGFIHHSNLGSYGSRVKIYRVWSSLPRWFRSYVLPERVLGRLMSTNTATWRAPSMTAPLFREYCQQAGLACASQELVSWGRGSCLTDAFSIFVKPESRSTNETKVIHNSEFAKNGRHIASLATLYCS